MILIVFTSLSFSLKIYQKPESFLVQKTSKFRAGSTTNGFCPTYSIDQKSITSSCSTKSMSYSDGYDPAYIIDSSKNSITFDLQYCNFSHYKLTSLPIYSLIHITGSNPTNLNVIKCNFNENKFPHTSGIFYTSKGDHSIFISSSNFVRNEGSDATILSDTCSSLTISNCYIGYNKCNGFKGQIYLKSRSTTYKKSTPNNEEKSANSNQISLTSVTFLLNECSTRNSMLLDGYTSISFSKCSFSCSGNPKSMIELNGRNIISLFNDCCFYGYFPYYSYDYHHIYFTYTANAGNKAVFSGTNSFGGEKSYVSNLKLSFDDGNFMFKISECVHIDATPTSTPKITDSPSPTDFFSPSVSPSIIYTEIPTQSPTESLFVTQTTVTSEIEPSEIESYSTSSSDASENDNSDEFDKSIFNSRWFIITVIVLVVVALILAFVAGWFISKSCNNKDDRSMKLNASDTFHSTLLSD